MDSTDDWTALVPQVQAWIDDDPDPQTASELTELLAVATASPRAREVWTGGEQEAGRDRGGDLGEDRAGDQDAEGQDLDPAYVAQVEAVQAARAELADRFSGLLQFGTAGLRGTLGGGPHRMNRAVVIRAAAGLGQYLLDELDGQAPPRVVVGYDARRNSSVFAQDTASVLTAMGVQVLLMPSPLPTPVLAFAVRDLGADAGVMVTASHNPADDNGYKVYLGGRVVVGDGQGAQIVPPYDAAIAAQIARVPSVASVPAADDGWQVLGPEVVQAYLAAAGGVVAVEPEHAAGLRIVLTPMHGVGGATALRLLRAAGFDDVHVVREQADPDPAFPTVAFPNPEEPGAIDLALALADTVHADLVLALDPDADRCAVAVQDPRRRDPLGTGAAANGWRMLHGDETGALLGDALARQHAGGEGALACSIVSSRLLGAIAADAGLQFATTLTGFKWIARTPGLVFGYEEALGYCVDPAHVRDKDGMSAALRVAALAAAAKTAGRTLLDTLDGLARRHGLYLTDQVSARFDDLDQIPALMDRLRGAPPATLAGSHVVSVVDLAAGTDDDRGGLPPTDGVRLLAADDTRVVVRPSGTEPKVKAYLEVVVPVPGGADDEAVTAARREARARLDAVADDVRRALGLPGR